MSSPRIYQLDNSWGTTELEVRFGIFSFSSTCISLRDHIRAHPNPSIPASVSMDVRLTQAWATAHGTADHALLSLMEFPFQRVRHTESLLSKCNCENALPEKVRVLGPDAGGEACEDGRVHLSEARTLYYRNRNPPTSGNTCFGAFPLGITLF